MTARDDMACLALTRSDCATLYDAGPGEPDSVFIRPSRGANGKLPRIESEGVSTPKVEFTGECFLCLPGRVPTVVDPLIEEADGERLSTGPPSVPLPPPEERVAAPW